MVLASCGKSDQEKAEEFVKTLDKDAEVLFVLPDSMPKCVFYAEDNLIKCHNVETDSTTTIPYGDIDEEYVSEILPGKSNIMVITKDYDTIDGVYVYDVAKGRFTKIDPRGNNMKITETKLSKSNQSITFTCDTTAKAPYLALMCFLDSTLDYETEKAKTGYNRTVKTYNFDGKLVKSKSIRISYEEWDKERSETKGNDDGNSSDNSSSPAIYLWRCDKCGEEQEGASYPSTYGCPWNGHQWTRVSRIR